MQGKEGLTKEHWGKKGLKGRHKEGKQSVKEMRKAKTGTVIPADISKSKGEQMANGTGGVKEDEDGASHCSAET